MLKRLTVVAASLLCAPVLAQQTSQFEISYIDPAGQGAYDPAAFNVDGKDTTVGEYRRELIQHVARVVSLQFNHTVPHKIDVNFGVPKGFAAMTLGPSFSEFTESDEKDPYGFLTVGRHYPSTLVSALTGKKISSDEDAIMSFADAPQDLTPTGDYEYPPIVYSAYHEMMHVLGFATTDCLGDCIPQPVSQHSHFSSNIYYNDAGTIKAFDSLTLADKTTAYLSIDNLWFGGSATSKDAAMDELTAGHSNGYVYMYATPNPDTDNVDGQSGSHFSFDVQPAQLMHSARASTDDLGMAAYLLCDAGWCQEGGKVIEQSVDAFINVNASSESETVIDISISENLNVGVDEFELTIYRAPDMQIIDFQDTENACVTITGGYRCVSGLSALEKVELRLIVTPANEYRLIGELRSTGFDVDRNGFNNILDTTLVKANAAPVVTSPTTPAPTPAPTPTAVSSDSGGGSMSLMLIPLAFFAFYRRNIRQLRVKYL